MKDLINFTLKAVIIAVIAMVCISHVLSNLQVQHVDADGFITDSYNVVECYNVLDFKK